MMPATTILTVILATVFGVALLWVLGCLALRATNFNADGTRRRSKHTQEDDKRRSEVIEYHNNAVYRAFEFYIKITLAVFGGMAYVVTSDKVSAKTVVHTLLDAGSWLLLASALVFSFVVFIHQKSKVERWVTRYAWWESLLWIEFPFIAVMMTVSIVVRMLVLPALMTP
jgi:hypothetical protein